MYSELIEKIEQYFQLGCTSSKSDFHILYFSYFNHLSPRSVSVVLRRYHAGCLFFHTDIRSQKVLSLENKPCHALFYSRSEKIQLCCEGTAFIHHQNTITKKQWESSRDMSKECYRQMNPPSSIKLGHTVTKQQLSLSQAYDNFAVVEIRLSSIEILKLFHTGNKRYRLNLEKKHVQELYP